MWQRGASTLESLSRGSEQIEIGCFAVLQVKADERTSARQEEAALHREKGFEHRIL